MYSLLKKLIIQSRSSRFSDSFTNASAQSRLEATCWSESSGDCTASNTKPNDFPPVTKFYACNSGGHRGFNPDYVCQDLCGAPMGAKCGIYTKAEWGHGGGNCGTRWAQVAYYPQNFLWSPTP
jgi:hypothetical protein